MKIKTVLEKLYNDFILLFGLPGNILQNQGKESENGPLKSL